MNLKSTHPLITPDYGAMAPRTAVDFFRCCGAIAFFSLLPIKRAASERFEIMPSFTNKADELYLEAENVKLQTISHRLQAATKLCTSRKN